MNGAVAASAAPDELAAAIVRIHRAGPALRDSTADWFRRERRTPLARAFARDRARRVCKAADRSVLHVLPHPGGGGETYVDVLSEMPGYRFDRIYLAPRPTPSVAQLARGVVAALRNARGHDLLHVHGEVAGGLCLPLLATRPSVVTLHGLHLTRRVSGIRGKASALNLRAVVRAADRTICVSEAEHDELTAIIGPAASKAGRRDPQRRPASVSGERRRASRGAPGARCWRGGAGRDLGRLARRAQGSAYGYSCCRAGLGRAARRRRRAAAITGRARPREGPRASWVTAATFLVFFRPPTSSSSRHAARGSPSPCWRRCRTGCRRSSPTWPKTSRRSATEGSRCRPVTRTRSVRALGRLAQDGGERVALGKHARSRVVEHFDARKMISRTRAIYDEILADAVGRG